MNHMFVLQPKEGKYDIRTKNLRMLRWKIIKSTRSFCQSHHEIIRKTGYN